MDDREGSRGVNQPVTGSLHHVELWVPDLERARQQWGWLLGELGHEQFQDWVCAGCPAQAPRDASVNDPRRGAGDHARRSLIPE